MYLGWRSWVFGTSVYLVCMALEGRVIVRVNRPAASNSERVISIFRCSLICCCSKYYGKMHCSIVN